MVLKTNISKVMLISKKENIEALRDNSSKLL